MAKMQTILFTRLFFDPHEEDFDCSQDYRTTVKRAC